MRQEVACKSVQQYLSCKAAILVFGKPNNCRNNGIKSCLRRHSYFYLHCTYVFCFITVNWILAVSIAEYWYLIQFISMNFNSINIYFKMKNYNATPRNISPLGVSSWRDRTGQLFAWNIQLQRSYQVLKLADR